MIDIFDANGVSRNNLTNAQKTQLGAALNGEWDTYILRSLPTYDAAAAYFSRKVGFDVTGSNVALVTQHLNRSWPRSRGGKADAAVDVVSRADHDELRAQVEALSRQLADLKDHFKRI